MTAPDSVRVEVWSDLEALGGERLADVPAADLLALATPDSIGRLERLTCTVAATSPVVASVGLKRVLRVETWRASATGAPARTGVEEWRIQTDRLTTRDGRCTITAVPPILDWGACGHIREIATGGLVIKDFGGVLTPQEVIEGFVLPYLVASGNDAWSVGTVDRTDARGVHFERQTPLEVLRLVETTWALEAVARRTTDGTYVLDLLAQAGATDADPLVLDVGAAGTGALTEVTRTRDATDLATVVEPLGADGGDMGQAAWTVAAVNFGTGWVDLVDDQGGPGPVQIDGQLVGTYVETAIGTVRAVVASLTGDGFTSQVQLDDATDLSVGEWLQFRADADRTRLVLLEHPTAVQPPPVGFGRVVVSVPNDGVRGEWNLVRKPYLGRHADAWTEGGVGPWERVEPTGLYGGTPPTLALVTDPPVGNPLGDDLPVWQTNLVTPGGSNFFHCYTGWTPVLTASAGDAVASGYLVLYIDAAMSKVLNTGVTVSGYTGLKPWTGVGKSVKVTLERQDAGGGPITTVAGGPTWTGRSWLALGPQGAALTGAARYRLKLEATPGSGLVSGVIYDGHPLYVPDNWSSCPVYLAFGQITRTPSNVYPIEGAGGNALWQLGNAYLRDHADGPTAIEAAVIDRARLDPARYGDQPLTLGRDVIVTAPALGLTSPARIMGVVPDRLAPGAPGSLVLATPSQRKTLTEEVWAWLKRTGRTDGARAGSTTTDAGTTPTIPGLGGTTDGAPAVPVATAGQTTTANLIVTPVTLIGNGVDEAPTPVQQAGGSPFGAGPTLWSTKKHRVHDLRNAAGIRLQGALVANGSAPDGFRLVLCPKAGSGDWLDAGATGATFPLDVAAGYHVAEMWRVPAAYRQAGVLLGLFGVGGDGTAVPLVGDLSYEVLPADPTDGSSDWATATDEAAAGTFCGAFDEEVYCDDLTDVADQAALDAALADGGRYSAGSATFVSDSDGSFARLTDVSGALTVASLAAGATEVWAIARGKLHFGGAFGENEAQSTDSAGNQLSWAMTPAVLTAAGGTQVGVAIRKRGAQWYVGAFETSYAGRLWFPIDDPSDAYTEWAIGVRPSASVGGPFGDTAAALEMRVASRAVGAETWTEHTSGWSILPIVGFSEFAPWPDAPDDSWQVTPYRSNANHDPDYQAAKVLDASASPNPLGL